MRGEPLGSGGLARTDATGQPDEVHPCSLVPGG